MRRTFTAALVAALMLSSAGIASAQPAWHAGRGVALNMQETERYCYLPLDVHSRILQQVSPCVTN